MAESRIKSIKLVQGTLGKDSFTEGAEGVELMMFDPTTNLARLDIKGAKYLVPIARVLHMQL